jgi:hypothetical protein
MIKIDEAIAASKVIRPALAPILHPPPDDVPPVG